LGEDDWLASAGLGMELGLARSPVRIRLDLPVWVSQPELAASARDEEFAPRLQVMFSPARWN
jgi:hypothetical protein